jgi:hypothetical protein
MRWLIVGIAIAICACGGKNGAGNNDAGGGDDDGGKPIDAGPVIDVIPGDAGPAVVRITLTDRPSDPSQFEFLVAYQDGDGAWMEAPPPVGDTYSFTVASGRYGYAWTCHQQANTGGNGTELHLVKLGMFAVSEHTHVIEQIPAGCTDAVPTSSLNGTIANRPAIGGRFFVTWGATSVGVEGISGGYSMAVDPGTHDLIVGHAVAGNVVGDAIVDSQVVVRNVTVSANGTTKNVDFANAPKAQTFAVTIPTPGQTRASTNTVLYTANGTTQTMVRDTAGPFETNALAQAQMSPNDTYEQVMSVAAGAATAVTSSATSAPAAIAFTAPQALGLVSINTATKVPYPQLASGWQAYPGAVGYQWNAVQNAANGPLGCILNQCLIVWTASIGAGWTGTSTKFQMPDLSAVPGWVTGYQPLEGVAVNGDTRALTSTAGGADFPFDPPAPGTKRVDVRTAWTTTP